MACGSASAGRITPHRRMLRRIACSVALAAAHAFAVRAADPAPRMLLLDAAVVHRDIVAVGERGAILRSEDNGLTWQTASSPTHTTLTSVTFYIDPHGFLDRPTRGWAVGHDALILTSADAGRTWQKQWQGENLTDSFLSVLALDAQHVIAVGAYGLFVTTADGGQTWTRRKILAEDNHLNRLTRGPTGTLYLAGEHGVLLRSADSGATWAPLRTGYDGSFYGILPLDKRTLLAHGLRGHLFRSADDGATWVSIPGPAPFLLGAALQLPGNTLVLGGNARSLLISRDYGKSVTALVSPVATAVAALVLTPDGQVLALGEAGATILPAPQ